MITAISNQDPDEDIYVLLERWEKQDIPIDSGWVKHAPVVQLRILVEYLECKFK